MDLKNCVPADKYDLAAIDRATQLGLPAITPILTTLLEWGKDGNWPVAAPTTLLLTQVGPEITPCIRDVLNSNDGMWKYWTICLVVKNCSTGLRLELQADLAGLVSAPSQDDLDCGIPEAAHAVLSGLNAAK